MDKLKRTIQATSKYLTNWQVYKLLNSRTVKALSRELVEEEKVHYLLKVSHEDQLGYLALADDRILFAHKGLLGTTIRRIPLEFIESIKVSRNIFTNTITILTDGRVYTFRLASIMKSRTFIHMLRQRIYSNLPFIATPRNNN